MKILVIGSGAREHAMIWKLSQSPNVSDIICAPGNAGIAEIASCVEISDTDIVGILALVQRDRPDLVVIGPEAPLAAGLADALRMLDVFVFGPTQAAAQLESSKAFTKEFCKRHNIPTADYAIFDAITPAKAYIKSHDGPYVIKADGLAAGKGVIICETQKEAEATLKDFFGGQFGDAGQTIVIEEFLTGQEASFFAICDDTTAVPLIAAQDHKQVGEGDTGPNTGGMGAYSPTPVFDEDMMQRVMSEIIQPTLDGMKKEGHPFSGVLFAGLMMTDAGPKLIEYNVRFGDPECQVIMRRLSSDLADIMLACARGKLDEIDDLGWFNDPTVNVVLATKGYPGSYEKGSQINDLEEASNVDDIVIFHAGTARDKDGALMAIGGRVLSVTAQKPTLKEAVDAAYAAIDKIDWPEGFCRRDIAHKAL